MRILFLLFFLLGYWGHKTTAQSLNENDIIGIWSVKRVNSLIDLPEDQNNKMQILKEAFQKARFEFKEDKKFSFHFEFEDLRIKDAHWKFSDSTGSFIIQEWEDKETDNWILIEIITVKEGDRILFILEETFFALEMEKHE